MAVTGEGSLLWFLDAWHVVDGRAFASRRLPEEPTNTAPRTKGSVFLSAPYFEPEWTSRPSTAMAAWRLGFQPGLRGANGEEIGFSSLENLREFVRRAFIAAGGGGMNPAGSVIVDPGPEPETPARDRAELSTKKLPALRGSLTKARLSRTDREGLQSRLLSVRPQKPLADFVSDSLSILLRRPPFATNSLGTLASDRWLEVAMRWSSLLLALEGRGAVERVWAHAASNGGFPLARRYHHLRRYFDSGYYDWLEFMFADRGRSQHVGGGVEPLVDLPRWIPLPKRWRDGLPGWLNSLGDAGCLLMASHARAGAALDHPEQLVTAFATAFAFVLISPLPFDWEDPSGWLDESLKSAANWLAESLPDASLSEEEAATHALDEMLDQRIDLYHRDQSQASTWTAQR